MLGVRVGQDRFWLLGTVALVTLGLYLFFRFTRFGIATRASAENEKFATLLGLQCRLPGWRQLGARVRFWLALSASSFRR